MLRAVVLRPFLRGILRFSTTGHPEALGACYVASWQLPRLDSHQLADDSFQDTRRVRGWRLGCHILVSIPCHLEPYVRFSLIRLSDRFRQSACSPISKHRSP